MLTFCCGTKTTHNHRSIVSIETFLHDILHQIESIQQFPLKYSHNNISLIQSVESSMMLMLTLMMKIAAADDVVVDDNVLLMTMVMRLYNNFHLSLLWLN